MQVHSPHCGCLKLFLSFKGYFYLIAVNPQTNYFKGKHLSNMEQHKNGIKTASCVQKNPRTVQDRSNPEASKYCSILLSSFGCKENWRRIAQTYCVSAHLESAGQGSYLERPGNV